MCEKTIPLSAHVYAAPSLKGGRGVFAQSDFAASTLLSLSLSWELSPDDIAHMDRTSIEGFWFTHPERAGWGLFPIGPAALVNCSLQPNADIVWRRQELGWVGHLIAIKPIAAGDEVLVDYGIGLPEGWVP